MSNLVAADLLKVIECARALMVPQDLDAFTAVAIRVIPPLVNAKLAGYNEVDPPRGRFGFSVYPPEYMDERALKGWVKYAHENPLIQHIQKNPTDYSVYKITDFISQEEFRKTGLCREFYQGLFGAEYQIAMPFPEPGPVAVAIAFNRATDFTERDREILKLIQPLVVEAYRKAAARTDLLAAQENLVQAMQSVQPCMAIASADGSIIACGPDTERFFGKPKSPSLRMQTPTLPEPVLRWLKSARSTGDNQTAEPSPLVHTDGKRQVTISLIATSKDGSCVLTIREASTKSRAPLLKFGLTKRETEVLGRLAHSESNREIARRLNIKVRTIEKHIEHLLPKLNVASRTAACVLAAGLFEAITK